MRKTDLQVAQFRFAAGGHTERTAVSLAEADPQTPRALVSPPGTAARIHKAGRGRRCDESSSGFFYALFTVGETQTTLANTGHTGDDTTHINELASEQSLTYHLGLTGHKQGEDI